MATSTAATISLWRSVLSPPPPQTPKAQGSAVLSCRWLWLYSALQQLLPSKVLRTPQAPFPGGGTNWTTTSTAFVSCLCAPVILRAAACDCTAPGPCCTMQRQKCWPTVQKCGVVRAEERVMLLRRV